MKTFKLTFLLLPLIFFSSISFAQSNATINMLTLNSGNVGVNGIGTLEVAIGNTGPSVAIAAGKINATISAQPLVTFAPDASQTLPAGWIIRNNLGSSLILCNSSTTIPVGTITNINIALVGGANAGSGTISGSLAYRTNCTAPGSLSGNNTADDIASAGFIVSSVVPVNLSNFNISIINCKPVLNWSTATEVNSDKFLIEKSDDLAASWKTAGAINAMGYAVNNSTYKFTDNSINGSDKKIYYRLKMIDLDGSFKYSETLPVSLKCNTQELSAFPNPVKDGRLFVSLSGSNNTSVGSLFSASGQLIMKVNLNNGTNNIDVSKISNGLYILNTNDGKADIQNVKVIIQK